MDNSIIINYALIIWIWLYVLVCMLFFVSRSWLKTRIQYDNKVIGQFCLFFGSPNNVNRCPFGRKSTGEISNNNNIYFGRSVGGVSNPMTFPFAIWQVQFFFQQSFFTRILLIICTVHTRMVWDLRSLIHEVWILLFFLGRRQNQGAGVA